MLLNKYFDHLDFFIDLDSTFKVNSRSVSPTLKFKFPGGESHIMFPPFYLGLTFEENEKRKGESHFDFRQRPVLISNRIRSNDDLIDCCLAADVVIRNNGIPQLFIPYFPYSRQDRPTSSFEPCSLGVIYSILMSSGYKRIYTYDLHSDVLKINPSINNISNEYFVKSVIDKIGSKKNLLLVAPDGGAVKKVSSLARKFNLPYCSAVKVRDITSGAIISISLVGENIENKICLIVDDIVDGGATFVKLGEILKKRNPAKIFLAISHGIFSKGTSLLNIDHIYTTDSYQTLENTNTLSQFKLFE